MRKDLAVVAALVLLIMGVTLWAGQTQPPPAKPESPASAAPAPKCPDDLALAINRKLLDEARLQNQATQAQQQIQAAQQAFLADQKEIGDLTEKAYKAAGVSPKDFTFDPETATFKPVPKSAAPPGPTPAPKASK